ncbi:exportin-T-like, partial [Pollicipes pollicipes]|uniref:exportin-T-like n=1 Tax=Pollicipes pollicipes TaxID=41117 RepID=UPI0018851F5A
MEAVAAEEFVRRLRGLIEPDAQLQRAGLAYLDGLKASDDGWRLCVDALLSPALDAEEHVQFYCLQAVEHFVKTRYPAEADGAAPAVRLFISGWVQRQCKLGAAGAKTYLRNKAAQVFALIFVADFPDRWPTFLLDLMGMAALGPPAVDMYLRTLLQIDQEIVDRDVVHSEQEARRNTRIRDAMREKCVLQLVESWHGTLQSYATTQPHLVCMCLEVVGKFVSWIDIGLVANERFVAVLVTLLGLVDVREAAADCLHDITHKGMEPVPKVQLVESLFAVLQQAAVFQLLERVNDQTPAEDVDYLCKLGKVLNGMGIELVLCYHKLAKAAAAAPGSGALAATEAAIGAKVQHMLAFLKCDYDDPSRSVIDFARDYVQLLKTKPMLSEAETGHVRDMVYVIIHKLKYDDDYDFQAMGEDEAMFQEYRKRLKVLYDNLAAVDRDLVLHITQQFICSTLDCWKSLPMRDVEAAITMLYMLGEALPPASAGNFFSDEPAKVTLLQTMMRRLVTSDVVSYPHHIVPFQYFETVSRYEKFFTVEAALLPQVLTAFLDERGMNHPNERNRARAVYLFSRFIKCLKVQMGPFTDTILGQIKNLLSLDPSDATLLNREDQLYLFETVAVLIISAASDNKHKCEQLQQLLGPVVGQVGTLSAQLESA